MGVTPRETVGLILLVIGAFDAFVVWRLVAPKIPDEGTRAIVTKALVAGGLAMMAVGVALYFR